MRRPVLRTVAVAAITAVLVGLAAPSIASGEWPSVEGGLPPCPAVPAVPAVLAAVTAPVTLPTEDDPTACRARATRVEPAGPGQLPIPRPGYHHLGATTVGEWSGIIGRLTVRDPAVRRDSYDFVATRFMAKRRLAGGALGWLEVGWAETGWSGGGDQRIYTFDSNAMSWVFYEGYEIADGDQVWIYLQSEPGGAWRAWLWWGSRWHQLAAPDVPLGERAMLEQYVEVHLDRRAAGPPISVPPIEVDHVQVRQPPDGPLVGWRADTVPTAPLLTSQHYCVSWQNQYDTWSAGDCAATVQR